MNSQQRNEAFAKRMSPSQELAKRLILAYGAATAGEREGKTRVTTATLRKLAHMGLCSFTVIDGKATGYRL